MPSWLEQGKASIAFGIFCLRHWFDDFGNRVPKRNVLLVGYEHSPIAQIGLSRAGFRGFSTGVAAILQRRVNRPVGEQCRSRWEQDSLPAFACVSPPPGRRSEVLELRHLVFREV